MSHSFRDQCFPLNTTITNKGFTPQKSCVLAFTPYRTAKNAKKSVWRANNNRQTTRTEGRQCALQKVRQRERLGKGIACMVRVRCVSAWACCRTPTTGSADSGQEQTEVPSEPSTAKRFQVKVLAISISACDISVHSFLQARFTGQQFLRIIKGSTDQDIILYSGKNVLQ